MKYIYTIKTCDRFKNPLSMSLLVVTTSKRRLLREIKTLLENGEIETDIQQVKNIILHTNINASQFCDELNNVTNYAYIEAWED